MKKNQRHVREQGCTHCGCDSPVIKALKKNAYHIKQQDFKAQRTVEPVWNTDVTTQKGLLVANSISFVEPEIDGGPDPGTIRPITGGDASIEVEAIAFFDDKVVAAGDFHDVKHKLEAFTTSYESRYLEDGQTLIPGMFDPHVHLVFTALVDSWLDCAAFNGQFMNPEYSVDYLKRIVTDERIRLRTLDELENLKDGDIWVLGQNADPALIPIELPKIPGLPNPIVTFNLQTMEKIGPSSDGPVMIQSASKHTFYINEEASNRIYEANKDDPDFLEAFDCTTLESFKEQTDGRLEELDQLYYGFKSIPAAQKALMLSRLPDMITKFFNDAVKLGITSVYEATFSDEQLWALDLYKGVQPDLFLPIRIGGARLVDSAGAANCLGNYLPPTRYSDFYIGHIKLVYDGSNQGLTGYQTTPYCCVPAHNTGLVNFEFPDFLTGLKTITEKGWPLMIHANGNKALEQVIEAYGYANNYHEPPTNHVLDFQRRNRIEHCSLLTPNQVERMKEYGIHPSFLIGHVGYWGWVFHHTIFEEKAQTLDLCRSTWDAGLKVTMHGDYSVSPMGPLRLVEQGYTRFMEAQPLKNGAAYPDVLNEEERLTVEEGLQAQTWNSAWQSYAESWAGSLEKGKFADFVILSMDPVDMSHQQAYLNMRAIPVLETWKGGVQVWNNADHPESSV